MKKTTITGSKALAAPLGVRPHTIWRWRNDGRLNNAIIADTGRVIIYDLDMVYTCLKTFEFKPRANPLRPFNRKH